MGIPHNFVPSPMEVPQHFSIPREPHNKSFYPRRIPAIPIPVQVSRIYTKFLCTNKLLVPNNSHNARNLKTKNRQSPIRQVTACQRVQYEINCCAPRWNDEYYNHSATLTCHKHSYYYVSNVLIIINTSNVTSVIEV